MFSSSVSKWLKLSVIVAATALALILAAGQVTATSTCKKINGAFTLQPVSGPTCTSPVGICATGVFKGDIKGNSEFTGTSLVRTVDTATTAVILLTGDNVIHTADGDLMTKDAIVLRSVAPGDFAEVDTILSGTGSWAGATGRFSATGTFDAVSGGEGTYLGEVCTP